MSGACCDTIYLDFAKVFDKVGNNIVLAKAYKFGIPANLLRLAGDAVTLDLFIIYTNCLNKGIFPNKWKKQMSHQFSKERTNKI